jgi:hypothetical protein
MLAGLALLALPVIAHLMNQAARHRIVFPSLRLLAPTRADHSRVHRPRRWLLLLLRVLAVMLLVLMFAQPVWQKHVTAGMSPDQPAAVVLLADVSASMGQRTDGVAAMGALRASAGRILRELVSGQDRANLVVAGARAEPQFPSLTANLPAVLKAIDGIAPTSARSDMEGAITVAGQQLAAHKGARHLVILTDRQRSNWEELERKAVALPPDVHLTCVPLTGGEPGNVSLAAPALEPALPAVGQAVTLTVRVSNQGQLMLPVPVTCLLEGQAVAERVLTLAPGESVETTFSLRFDNPGFHRVTVEIPDDGLLADNRLYCVAAVVERLPVIVIGDDDPDLPGTASYFLVRALSPHGGKGDRLRVRHLRGADVEASQLADAVGVFLVSSAAIKEESLRALVDYLGRGGGLWLFTGNPGMDGLAERLDQAVPGGCLPWKIGGLRAASSGQPLRIVGGDWQARLLKAFGPAQQESVAQIPFLRMREVSREHAASHRLLMYEGGIPALASRETPGGGRFYLANFAVDREAGDLARNGFFVALLHRAVEDLLRNLRRRESHFAGRPLMFVTARPFDVADGAPILVGPDGRIFSDASLRVNRQDLSVRLPVAETAGFYDLKQGDRLLGRAAVNLDPRESDLKRMDESQLLAALQKTGAASVRIYDMRDGDDLHGPGWRGTPLWGWAAALALAALMSEMFLLGIWRR